MAARSGTARRTPRNRNNHASIIGVLSKGGRFPLAEELIPPFSARNRGTEARIDDDCPITARIGIVHLLDQLVRKKFVKDWPAVISELKRINRISFNVADPYSSSWEQTAEDFLTKLPWERVYDFCQRIYSDLAQAVWGQDPQTGEPEISTTRDEVQKHIAQELQLLFWEENLAFEFSDGAVRRRGRQHTMDQIARSGLVLGDPKLSEARGHYNKALGFFRNVSNPDYENTVKEAVSAVEAAAQALFSSEGEQLDDILKAIEGSEEGQLPKPITKTFYGLYGFRGSGKGVAHGTAGTGSGAATKEIAEYALAITASQIVLLVNFTTASNEIPF